MATQSHFFIESGGFPSQNAPQSFGPKSPDEFRLTSSFTLSENTTKKAFAICKGLVLIQPQTGSSTKVNVILRPYRQPFPGLNVKYFVYRGLQRSDFFTVESDPKIIEPNSTTSDFINKINTDFHAFHDDRKDKEGNLIRPIPDFTAKYIGYDPLLIDETILLSSFFFKESEFVEATVGGVGVFEEKDDFELPLIAMGKSLGSFASGDCGIDVVLDYGDYKQDFDNSEFVFDLGYARATEATITIVTTDVHEQKRQREQSTQFIDIAAFYGLYVNDGKVKVSDAAATKTDKKGSEIYTDVINNFATKNNWYIYLQGDRTRSYDFYGNYKIVEGTGTTNLKTGLLVDTVTEATYGTNGWPILINTQTQSTPIANNNLYLQLVTDNNNNTALYGQIANIANAQKDNFFNADGLRQAADAEGNYSRLTTTVQLTTPATADGKNIANLSLLLYQGVSDEYEANTLLDENGIPIIQKGQANFFDDVFSLINAQPLLKVNGGSDFSKMTDGKLNLINQYYDKKQQGLSVVQTLTVNDVIETGIEETSTVARVTYLTEASDVMNNAVSATGSTTPDTKTSPSASGAVTKSKTYDLPEPYYYGLKLFTDSIQTITGLELKTLDGSTPNKIILGITKAENNSIKALITEGFKNPRLFLIDLFEDGNELLSPENIAYQKYRLGIVAENTDGNLELATPTLDVMVYSLDRKYHFSKGYSEYMPDLDFSTNYFNINTVL
ncbi:hypothetical protein [Flavobacterium degerlachei]|uniref:Uncharacterized protein n=1 Tax=Flavobacterium degerlachei TaxID=229203 RepID=A0A1H3E9T6_9FLAO|nr:hypothetical protein [Flavobacterium degerlachei]SDX75486.1 hypothetical protein SAMN05444338_11486 [Flavobacterium degerlachei]